jgi:hypothetical protein
MAALFTALIHDLFLAKSLKGEKSVD